ncbi:MAG: SDR family NAD(P)-dependent oxidoreductase [Mycobacteriaceae bacterium]|nr:SDR family NAD(P)-dependent oxidoreductase [Mycobacteriaceae bacterium]
MTYPKIALDGAVVAVTGGARGIGKATADLFASKGAVVCVGDLDPAQAADALVLDVTSRASFGAFVDTALERHGRIDILVNNAGVMPHMIERGRGHVVNVASMAGKRTRLASGVPLGHGLPTVDADDVACAIVGSVRSRRAEITVPRYRAGWDVVNAAVPEPVMRVGRKLIGDRRALTSVQNDVRAADEETIAAQARR